MCTPTPPGCAGSTCWPRRYAARGRAKVIFGSDGPWLHPGVELAKVLALGLPAPALQLVLGGNIRGLLGRARVTGGRVPVPGSGHPPRSLPAAADPWLPQPAQ